MRRERTWPTGQTPKGLRSVEFVEVGEQPLEAIRAGESGRVSAMRVFAQNDRRGLGVRLSSLLSPEDAQVYIADASNRMAEVRFRPSAKIVMTSQPTVEVAEIPGAEDARCLEHAALSVKGDLTILTAAGRVEACVFVVQGSYLRDKWSWDELAAIAAIQAERLHQASRR